MQPNRDRAARASDFVATAWAVFFVAVGPLALFLSIAWHAFGWLGVASWAACLGVCLGLTWAVGRGL